MRPVGVSNPKSPLASISAECLHEGCKHSCAVLATCRCLNTHGPGPAFMLVRTERARHGREPGTVESPARLRCRACPEAIGPSVPNIGSSFPTCCYARPRPAGGAARALPAQEQRDGW